MPDPSSKAENNEFGAVDDYDRFAYYYDLYYQQITADLDFYPQIAQHLGLKTRILELACGSGRLTLPLLRAGFSVTGLDLSGEMLELARQKLMLEPEEVQARAHFVQGDMRNLAKTFGAEKFELTIIGFSSFQHLLTHDDQLACLRSVYAQLTPGGLFLIMIGIPKVNLAEPAKGRMDGYGTFPNPLRQSQVTLLVHVTDYPEVHERHLLYQFYEKLPDGTLECITATLILRYFSPEELRLLLEEAGFIIEESYGSYGFEELTPDSKMIIYLCRRGA